MQPAVSGYTVFHHNGRGHGGGVGRRRATVGVCARCGVRCRSSAGDLALLALRSYDLGDLLSDPLGGLFDVAVPEVGLSERHVGAAMAEQSRDHRHRNAVRHRMAGMLVPQLVKARVFDVGFPPDRAATP